MGKEMFSENMSKILIEQLQKSEIIKTFITKTDTNSDEISKLYESLVEVRRIIIEGGSIITEKEKKDMMLKLTDLDLQLKRLRTQFDENIKGVEENPDQEDKDQPASIRDYIRHLAGNMKVMGDKVFTVC